MADNELPEWSYAEQSPEVSSPTASEVRAVLAAAEDTFAMYQRAPDES